MVLINGDTASAAEILTAALEQSRGWPRWSGPALLRQGHLPGGDPARQRRRARPDGRRVPDPQRDLDQRHRDQARGEGRRTARRRRRELRRAAVLGAAPGAGLTTDAARPAGRRVRQARRRRRQAGPLPRRRAALRARRPTRARPAGGGLRLRADGPGRARPGPRPRQGGPRARRPGAGRGRGRGAARRPRAATSASRAALEEDAAAAAAAAREARLRIAGTCGRCATFTVDPASAHDFDDAVSAERDRATACGSGSTSPTSPPTCAPASALEKEARRRANSTYVPGMVEPMLPQALSSDACSLVPERGPARGHRRDRALGRRASRARRASTAA